MYDSNCTILTVDEAAEILLTSKQTIYALLHKGDLSGFMLSGSWKIPKNAIEQYILSSSGLIKNKQHLD